jgi:phospholipid/cholesterol/gamma-HCH transport system substrate-binding protein
MEIITEDLKITTSKINRMLNNDISPLLTKTNNICQNLETTTSKFNNIDFVSLENNINTTMANVNSFTNRLNNENSSLGLLLNDASVYNNLDSTFRNASLLLEDLRMNPKRYVHFSIFGRK